MHLAVGHTAKEPVPARQMDAMASALENDFGVRPFVLSALDSRVTVLVLREPESRVIGVAQDGERGMALVLVGSLNRPLPEWDDGSAMDSADDVAAYLLARFARHGDGFLDGVYGSYAVLVVDHRNGRAVIAADPTGLRTVFFTAADGESWFGTNLRGLVDCMDPKPGRPRHSPPTPTAGCWASASD